MIEGFLQAKISLKKHCISAREASSARWLYLIGKPIFQTLVAVGLVSAGVCYTAVDYQIDNPHQLCSSHR